MRYSTEPKFRKYIKAYGFLSFARTFGDKYGKKLMDTATKKRMDAAKTASKRVVKKLQKLQKIYLEIKQLINLLQQENQKKKEKKN